MLDCLARLNAHALLNESATATVDAHSGAYAWPLDKVGVVSIRQASGNMLVSAFPGLDLTKLRQGRRYLLMVYNNSGGNVNVTFSAAFLATAVLIPNGAVNSWDLTVKDKAFTITETLIQTNL